MEEIKKLNIVGKNIYIFEDHSEAIIPWFKEGIGLKDKLVVLTFDYHRDTILAFTRYNSKKLRNDKYSLLIEEANIMSSQVNTINDVCSAVNKLKNDEHIDFSIRAKIISHAYVISHDTSAMFTIKSEELKEWEKENLGFLKRITGKQTLKPINLSYLMPENRIFELGKEHFDNMEVNEQKEKMDLSIDDINLKYRMSDIKAINKSLFGKEYDFTQNFILDIDLDYFNTYNSINPKNINIFYSLIRQAKAITIAKESWFVKECKLDDENVNVSYLLMRLLVHIRTALDKGI